LAYVGSFAFMWEILRLLVGKFVNGIWQH